MTYLLRNEAMLMLTVVSGVVSHLEWSQQPSPMPGEEHMTGVKVRLAPEGIMTVSTEMIHVLDIAGP